MSIYALKPRFQALLRPIARLLVAAGYSANQVTAATALISLLLGLLLAARHDDPRLFLLLPIWLLVRMALNAIDGVMAREHSQQSRLGAYLNEIGDVVADAALYLPFALVPPLSPAWVTAVVLLSALSELSGVLGQTIGASRRSDGPLGKSDRALLFALLGGWVGLSLPRPALLAWTMPAAALLLAATVAHRVYRGLREAEDLDWH